MAKKFFSDVQLVLHNRTAHKTSFQESCGLFMDPPIYDSRARGIDG